MDTGSCGALSYPPLKTFLQKGERWGNFLQYVSPNPFKNLGKKF